MSERPNAVIVTGRCSRNSDGFGIRYQETSPNQWIATWAFTLNEKLAKREGYSEQIAGSFGFGEEYPGCPHCEAQGCVLCECGKLGCWDGASSAFTCPHCARTGEISGDMERLSAGGDR